MVSVLPLEEDHIDRYLVRSVLKPQNVEGRIYLFKVTPESVVLDRFISSAERQLTVNHPKLKFSNLD